MTRVFSLCGFGFTHLGKIINIRKIVWFTMRTRICAAFGRAQVKVDTKP